MPFILPVGCLLYKMKQLQYKPVLSRVKFLKNFYITRLVTYPSVYFLTTFILV